MRARKETPAPRMADSWEGLRREARSLEAALENRLQQFGKIDALACPPASDGPADIEAGWGEEKQAREIEETLEKLGDVVERMGRVVAEHPSQANAATVQRYREIAHDFKSTFRRQHAALRQKRENSALFHSLRDGGTGRGPHGDMGAIDALLRERGSLSTANRTIDEILEQAAAARDTLARQRGGIMGAANRLGTLATHLPGVGQLMDAINRRRARNDQVLALVVGVCLCFALWYFVLRKVE